MTSLDLFFTLAVLAAVLAAVGYFARFVGAVREGHRGSVDLDRELIDLLDRKSHLVEDLRDLELDFRMGKIAEEDYEQQRMRLEPATVAVIRELEDRGYRSDVDDLLDDDEGDPDILDEDLLDEDLLDEDLLDEDPHEERLVDGAAEGDGQALAQKEPKA